MTFSLLVVVATAALSVAGAASPQGFLSQALYVDRDCEQYGKPFALSSTAYGECVKIFNGPEDPTTELTSYKLEVTPVPNTPQLQTKFQVYLDSACKKPAGQSTESVITLNNCISSNSQTQSGPSAAYINQTSEAYIPAEIEGLSVLGFQEPSHCSANKELTYEIAYPNDACVQGSGTVKKGAAYASFTYYCSGIDLLQTFFTDSACTQALSSVTIKLGSVDTTCYTNQMPSYDYNLFQTMKCVGSASPKTFSELAQATQAENRLDIKTPCPHKTATLHGLGLLPPKANVNV